MNNVVDLNAKQPLSGSWRCCDGFSDTEISIGFAGNMPSVVVCDKYNGEVPQVLEVSWESERSRLTFLLFGLAGASSNISSLHRPRQGEPK